MPAEPASSDAKGGDDHSLYLESWLFETSKDIKAIIDTAISYQEKIESIITSLQATGDHDAGISDPQQLALSSREVIGQIVHPICFNERHSTSCIPSRVLEVFQLPELFKNILENVTS